MIEVDEILKRLQNTKYWKYAVMYLDALLKIVLVELTKNKS